VRDQLVAHVRHGYKPVLFVLTNFEGEVPEGVEVRKVVPKIILEPYKGMGYPETIDDDVRQVKEAFVEHMADIDILLTHDVVFIDTYLPYNMGLREAKLKAKQYHWIHSAPSPRPEIQNNPHANRYTLPPNSKLVYLNHDKQIALAEMYGTEPHNVRVIPNSRDARTFWGLDPLVSDIINDYKLYDADIISVYPLSSTRMIDGKQIDVVIKLHEKLRQLGMNAKLIVPNAHANGDKEKAEIQARSNEHVCFTSNYGHEDGVSSDVVSQLFRLSNVFIFPSISENCSLVLLEAMLAGNLLVLNEDCTGLKEFGGDDAIYFRMGGLSMGVHTKINAMDTEDYYLDIAKIIKSEVSRSRSLHTKTRAFKRHNIDVMFSQLENLYYE
jgi:glycosyltransferase involved in cell wall biosynthesis